MQCYMLLCCHLSQAWFIFKWLKISTSVFATYSSFVVWGAIQNSCGFAAWC